jgi:hypothetical protein
MTTRMTPNDWETLSAYLDNELNVRDRARLEQRLKAEPGLRQALTDLRETRAVLRAAPRLRAPRNFTLTPQMAGARAGVRPLPPAFPVLRLASVLATVFFVLISVGSLLVVRYGPAPVVVEANPAMEGRPMGGGGMGMGGGPAPAAPAVAMEAQQATDEAVAEALATGAPVGELLSTPAMGLDQQPGLAASPEVDQRYAATPQPEAEGLNANSAAAKAPEGQPQSTADTSSALSTGWIVLGGVQLLLAVLAIGSGLAAYAMRRAAKR